ncbi:glycosyltransferase family 2 protein, partial [Acinetobacter baumannii]
DGSTDDTASVAERFEGIRVLRKPNGGKASALNLAISEATGDLMVCIDADTQLGADAIRLLVQPFKDSQIAAVAGNVRVGNVDNVLTAWQDV